MIILKKKYTRLQKEHDQLREDYQQLRETLRESLKKQNPPVTLFDVLKQILGQDLSWFDYNELGKTEMEKYFLSSQRILNEPIFQNEMNFLKSNWGKQSLLEACSLPKKQIAEHVQKMSWMILGIEMLKQRLESIQNPHSNLEKPKDPFAAL